MNLISSNKTSRFSGVSALVKEMLIAVVAISFIVIFPETARASLFSSIESIFGATASAQESVATSSAYNAQTYQILGDSRSYSTSTDDMYIADDTLVPSIGPSGSIADIDNQPQSTAISTYVVQSGDTLSQIAEMFDVSVNTIVWANDLGTDPVIQPGETLIILPVSGIDYTVKKGDTLASIVSKYGGGTDQTDQINEILEYNDLPSASAIAVGDTIIIPDGELGGNQSVSTPSKGNSTEGGSSYEPLIPGDGGPAMPGPYAGGYYACPVHGSWLSQGLHGHNAVDLALGIGNPIYAAADGTVIIAKTGGWNGGYGDYVVISHSNGTETLYAHAEKVLVYAGEQVIQGQEIAKIGVTGLTTGPHLHFEVRGAANPFLTVPC